MAQSPMDGDVAISDDTSDSTPSREEFQELQSSLATMLALQQQQAEAIRQRLYPGAASWYPRY